MTTPVFEVWYGYPRPYHSWENLAPTKAAPQRGKCRHCPATHEGSPASTPACAAREARMIVDGRSEAQAWQYIDESAAPTEREHWEVRPEKPVKLWAGARVHHQGELVMLRESLSDAKRYIENEAKLPYGIHLDGKLIRRSASEDDAKTTIAALERTVQGKLTSELYVPRKNPGEHERPDHAEVLHRTGDWSVHHGAVVGKFDTVGDAAAYRDKLISHTKADAEYFTITGSSATAPTLPAPSDDVPPPPQAPTKEHAP